MGAVILESNNVGGIDKENMLSLSFQDLAEKFPASGSTPVKNIVLGKAQQYFKGYKRRIVKNKHQKDNGRLGSSHMRTSNSCPYKESLNV